MSKNIREGRQVCKPILFFEGGGLSHEVGVQILFFFVFAGKSGALKPHLPVLHKLNVVLL